MHAQQQLRSSERAHEFKLTLLNVDKLHDERMAIPKQLDRT